MITMLEGQISYEFSDEFSVVRLEASTYYCRHWQNFAKPDSEEGNKECDFIAFNTKTKELWLIEVKDYRGTRRTKPSSLADEFALKCRDSIGCLYAIKLSTLAQNEEKTMISPMMDAKTIRCVLHVEQTRYNRLFPSVIDPKALRDSTKKRLRPLDPHALGGDASSLAGQVPWGITV